MIRRFLSPGAVSVGVVTAFALLLVTLVAVSARYHAGVDLLDESFGLATTHRLLLGDRPFIDEASLMPTTAILTLPFFRLYYFFHHGNAGVALFSRELQWWLSVILAGFSYRALKPRVGRAAALLGSLFFIAVPCQVPGMTYATLGSGLYALGVLLLLPSTPPARWARFRIVLTGLAHGMASLAHPAFLMAGLGFGFILLARPGISLAVRVLCYGIPFLMIWVVFFSMVSVPSFWQTIHFIQSLGFGYGNHEKWNYLRFQMGHLFTSHAQVKFTLGAGTVALLVLARRWYPPLSAVLISLVPWIAARLTNSPPGFLLYFVYLGSLAAFWSGKWSVDFGAWLASLVAFFAMVVVSNGGLVGNAYLGLTLAAVLVAAGLLERLNGLAAGLFAVGFLAPLLLCPRPLMGDCPAERLSVRVEEGPYRGLFTTPRRARFLRQLGRDLAALAPPPVGTPSRVLFYPDYFPAGYLMSDYLPATRALWFCPPNDPAGLCWGYFKAHAPETKFVVRLKKRPFGCDCEASVGHRTARDPVERAIDSNYAWVSENEYYVIYRPNR